MGKITDIAEQKKNKSRCSIYIDGAFKCGLDRLTVISHRLEIGDDISDEELGVIQRESEGAAAFEKCIGYLSYRMRSEREICDYLAGKGYLTVVINETLKKLKAYGYVDDEQFAKSYADSKRARYGMYKIARELKQLGISEEIIESLKEESAPQYDEAYDVIVKYIKTKRRRDKQKVRMYLASRGFGFDVIAEAVSRANDEGLFNEEEPEDGLE